MAKCTSLKLVFRRTCLISLLQSLSVVVIHVRFGMMHCYTVKQHIYACEKFMQIRQNGPLDKFM